MISAMILDQLNARLTTLQLPILTEAGVMALPPTVTVDRLTQAVDRAEQNDPGARLYLVRNLPRPLPSGAKVPAPQIAPARSAAPQREVAPITPARSAAPQREVAPVAPWPVTPPPTAEARPSERRDLPRCRIYGSKAALCVEVDTTRQDQPTLRLEVAPATDPKAYDWKRKLIIQLTREELPLVTATVLGFLPHCVCKNHGPEHNKGLEIVHQGTHLFLRVFQKDQGVFALPISPTDAYALASLCLRPLRQATPWLSDQGVLALLRLTVQRMALAAGTAQSVKQ